MKRREFIKGVTISGIAGAATSTFAGPAIAKGKRQLKMATTWPKNFPGLGTAAERLAKRITEATDDQLSVKVFAAGELVPAFEAFDAASSGSADMYHGAEYYWQGKSKAFNFFAAVPFGLTATEMDSWIKFGGGQELWNELAAKFNIKPFIAVNTGVQMGGWFNKKINSLEDYKGLKIRMPGLGGEVLRRIGAAAISLPGGEIFSSLQSGAIDATEWIGPWNDLAFGFYKIAKYYYYPGFHEPGTVLSCGINLDVWNSLSKSQQRIVTDCMTAEAADSSAEFNARNGDSLNILIKKHNVQLRKFPNDVMTAIGEISGKVIKEAASSDDITKRVYDSFIASRKKSIAWTKIADQAYRNARLLPFKYE